MSTEKPLSKKAISYEVKSPKRLKKIAKGKAKRAQPGYGNTLQSFMATGVSFRPNVGGFQVVQSQLGGRFK
jgi:hypothetical protein